MREPVLSVSACVEQDEQDNTTIAPFQIFDLSGAKYQLVIPYLIRNLSMLISYSLSNLTTLLLQEKLFQLLSINDIIILC